LDDVSLDVVTPELFSYSTLQCATVHQVVYGGLEAILAPRLSPVASRQRDLLADRLSGIQLQEAVNVRTLPLCDGGDNRIKISALYQLRTDGSMRSRHFGLSGAAFSIQGQILCVDTAARPHSMPREPTQERHRRAGSEWLQHLPGGPQDPDAHILRVPLRQVLLVGSGLPGNNSNENH
jgi:hypothetical protein